MAIVREGDTAPGGFGSFSDFDDVLLNDNGEVIFRADLEVSGIPGTDALFIWSLADGLRELIREGEELDLGGGLQQVVGIGGGLGFNNQGQIAINLLFQGNVQAVLLAQEATSGGFLEADFDEDGDVDANDLLDWQSGFGIEAVASHMQGDANADGDVDGGDFLTWQIQFGSVGNTASLSSARLVAIPEPTSFLLLVAGILALGWGNVVIHIANHNY